MEEVDDENVLRGEKMHVCEGSDVKAYTSDEETMRSIRPWRKSSVRPDLFVMAPMREVGERELIKELAEASYEVQGFHDARRRHFVSRTFPFAGSDFAYARFADQAFDVSEVTDGFYGVDNIDLTEWVGKSLSYERSNWQRLLTHVSDHPETDFVFLAYTRKEEEMHKLVESISSSCGIAIAIVKLDYPTVEGMAKVFVAYSPDLFEPHEGYVAERISSMREMGWRLGYASVRSSALSAIYETSMGSEVRSAIDAVFNIVVGILNQIMSGLITHAQNEHGGVLPNRVDFILDEMGNLPARIPDLEALVSAARSRNIRFHFVVQSADQLTNVYGEELKNVILDNCDTWVFMGSRGLPFLRQISELAGTVRLESGEERPLLSVDKLQHLETRRTESEALVFASSLQPFVAALKDVGRYEAVLAKAPDASARQQVRHEVFDITSVTRKDIKSPTSYEPEDGEQRAVADDRAVQTMVSLDDMILSKLEDLFASDGN